MAESGLPGDGSVRAGTAAAGPHPVQPPIRLQEDGADPVTALAALRRTLYRPGATGADVTAFERASALVAQWAGDEAERDATPVSAGAVSFQPSAAERPRAREPQPDPQLNSDGVSTAETPHAAHAAASPHPSPGPRLRSLVVLASVALVALIAAGVQAQQRSEAVSNRHVMTPSASPAADIEPDLVIGHTVRLAGSAAEVRALTTSIRAGVASDPHQIIPSTATKSVPILNLTEPLGSLEQLGRGSETIALFSTDRSGMPRNITVMLTCAAAASYRWTLTGVTVYPRTTGTAVALVHGTGADCGTGLAYGTITLAANVHVTSITVSVQHGGWFTAAVYFSPVPQLP